MAFLPKILVYTKFKQNFSCTTLIRNKRLNFVPWKLPSHKVQPRMYVNNTLSVWRLSFSKHGRNRFLKIGRLRNDTKQTKLNKISLSFCILWKRGIWWLNFKIISEQNLKTCDHEFSIWSWIYMYIYIHTLMSK